LLAGEIGREWSVSVGSVLAGAAIKTRAGSSQYTVTLPNSPCLHPGRQRGDRQQRAQRGRDRAAAKHERAPGLRGGRSDEVCVCGRCARTHRAPAQKRFFEAAAAKREPKNCDAKPELESVFLLPAPFFRLCPSSPSPLHAAMADYVLPDKWSDDIVDETGQKMSKT
jgi:hypothetical protein